MAGRSRLALIAFALLAVAAACTSSSSSSSPSAESTDPPPPTPEKPQEPSAGQGTVGASGGQVATSDGALTVQIPSGALPSDTTITITEIASPPDGAVGKTYEIGPTGTQFAVPVTLSFKYRQLDLDLQGAEPADLEASTIVDGAWVALASNAVDSTAQVVTGQTMHLSPYGIHAKGKGTEADSGPETGDTDASGNDSGTDSGSNAGGCTQHTLQSGSCANHPMQVCTTGQTFLNCLDLTPGISYMCCPPAS
jgi:hypothetical protein